MKIPKPLEIALCWQMHGVGIRAPDGEVWLAPETLQRALGVYTDMVAELEGAGNLAATLLLSPGLLQCISECAAAIDSYLDSGGVPAMALPGIQATFPAQGSARSQVLDLCLARQRHAFVERHPPYRELLSVASQLQRQPDHLDYLEDAFFHDLLMWHQIAWLASSVREHDPRVRRLASTTGPFSTADRATLLSVIGEQLDALIPRLRDLAASGQVALGFLCGSRRPDRVRADLAAFEATLGKAPSLYWARGGDPEGEIGRLLEDRAIQRVGGMGAAGRPAGGAAPVWRVELLCRMVEQSYRDWRVDDAVANCVRQLEDIADRASPPPGVPMALIIGDGRSWDRYPDSGSAFRLKLYRRLASHPRLHLTTLGAGPRPRDRGAIPTEITSA